MMFTRSAAPTRRRHVRTGGVTALVTAGLLAASSAAPAAAHGGGSGRGEDRPRAILMLDDSNTLVRYLLYSNEFDTQGLLYASSGVHWKGDGQGTEWFVPGREYDRPGLDLCPCTSWRWKPGERFIEDAVDIYEDVYPNLVKHAEGYPRPKELRSKIMDGNVEFDGDISKDTPGSDLIRRKLLDNSDEPVYLLTGAGQSTVARALKSIKDQYEGTRQWPKIYQKVSAKAVIQSWGDQDGTNASYIAPNWPDVEFRQMSTTIWGYSARRAVLPEDAHILTAEWTGANVSDVGPFGEFYRVWGDGKQMVPGDIFDYFGESGLTSDELRAKGYQVWTAPQPQGSWISEGDTSIFMNMLDNGLRAEEDPSWGGWGGRNAQDVGPTGTPSSTYAAARWFGAAQADFAARMRWTVSDRYSKADHEPAVTVDGKLDRTGRPGQTLLLNARVSDPDGDTVTTRWWQYADADTYPGTVTPVVGSARGGKLSYARVTEPFPTS